MNLLLFIFVLSYTEADLLYETDDGHKSKLFPSEERKNNYLTLSYKCTSFIVTSDGEDDFSSKKL